MRAKTNIAIGVEIKVSRTNYEQQHLFIIYFYLKKEVVKPSFTLL